MPIPVRAVRVTRLLSLPGRVARRVWRHGAYAVRRARDERRCTFSVAGEPRLVELLRDLDVSRVPLALELVHAVERWCDHRFDVLGSGWVTPAHGMPARGLEGHRYASPAVVPDAEGRWLSTRVGPANLAYATAAWRAIEAPYVPIDWHRDFKSGFRWDERSWYMDVPFGRLPGVDIKVPWELARMQHLPALALVYGAKDATEATRSRCMREFRNQILDFVATNPPRFGVNWRTAMDAGIRAANWLLAFDLFRAAGAVFDETFAAIFGRAILDHARHIASNLERAGNERGNHYLADIVGLLWCAAHLPADTESDAWLAFSVRELETEMSHQFLADGSNFEASTSYHRLSAELAVFGVAASRAVDARLQSLGVRAISDASMQKLRDAVEFSRAVTKPSGRIVQIGDNDSGRLFKLTPRILRLDAHAVRDARRNLEGWDATDEPYLDEQHLDHRHLRHAYCGLVSCGADDHEQDADYLVAQHLSGMSRARVSHVVATPRQMGSTQARPPVTAFHERVFPLPPGVLTDLERRAFPDFGLYIYRGARIFVGIRCGGLDPRIATAHAHNDQLAVEVEVDGVDLIADPGSYLYTPLPERRNQYRSRLAHFTPRHGDAEPASLDDGLFALHPRHAARCVAFEAHEFIGVFHDGAGPVWRTVSVHDAQILIVDACACADPSTHQRTVAPASAFSPGYGIVNV